MLPLLMLWGMNPATDKTPFGAPKKVTMQPRPASHENIVGKLLAGKAGFTYRDRDTVEDSSDDGIWWEEITIPVALDGRPSLNNISADYNPLQGWVLSIWTDEDIVSPADARAMAAGMVQGAALVEYLNDVTA